MAGQPNVGDTVSRTEEIPLEPGKWDITVRGSKKLCATLAEQMDDALLFRRLATLRDDVDVGRPDDWRWAGATPEFESICARLDAQPLIARAAQLADSRRDG